MKYFFLLICWCVLQPLQAQKTVQLEEAISTALKNNFGIQLSKGDSLIAALNYSYRNAALLPRVNAALGTSFTNNDQSQTFTDGTKRQRKGIMAGNVNAQVALNWTVYDGMKMFILRDRAGQLVQLGGLQIREQVVNTIAQVINGYYGIARQQQQLRAVAEQINIGEERVKLAQYRLDIGSGAKPEVLQGKVDLNALKAARLSQQNQMILLKQQLNQLMNVPLQTDYKVTDSIPFMNQLQLNDTRAAAQQNNPGLQVLQQNITLARLTIRERKADLLPAVSINSAYTFNRNNNKAVVNPFTPLLNRTNGFNLGVTASIPIFNNYNARRLIQQSELDLRLQQLNYANFQQQVDLAVLNAYQQYLMQQQALQLEEENIILAKENISIVLESYKLGAVTFIQLREAQQSLELAYNRLIAARYETKVAETELLRLQGRLLQ